MDRYSLLFPTICDFDIINEWSDLQNRAMLPTLFSKKS